MSSFVKQKLDDFEQRQNKLLKRSWTKQAKDDPLKETLNYGTKLPFKIVKWKRWSVRPNRRDTSNSLLKLTNTSKHRTSSEDLNTQELIIFKCIDHVKSLVKFIQDNSVQLFTKQSFKQRSIEMFETMLEDFKELKDQTPHVAVYFYFC